MNHREQLEAEIKKFDYSNGKIHLTFGVLIVAVLCAFLIVIATFTKISFFEGDNLLGNFAISNFVLNSKFWSHVVEFEYIPQVPVIIFISALLGNYFGAFAVFLYILAGLCSIPVFANGGGWRYIFQYSFGYIIAFLPAVSIAGRILNRNLSCLNALKASFFGVFIIHFIGIMYAGIIITFNRNGFDAFMHLVTTHCGISVIYDFVFSIIAVLIARPIKKILWLAMS